MTLFPRLKNAAKNIILYYTEWYIQPHIDAFVKLDKTSKRICDSFYQEAMEANGELQDEINQTISSSNHNVNMQLWANLKEWLQDRRIVAPDVELLINEIGDYNLDENTNDFLNEYCEVIEKIISDFKRIVNNGISLYESGNLIFYQTNQIAPTKLEEPQKISVTLNVADLSLLFRLLFDHDVFETKNKSQIHRLISSHFLLLVQLKKV